MLPVTAERRSSTAACRARAGLDEQILGGDVDRGDRRHPSADIGDDGPDAVRQHFDDCLVVEERHLPSSS
jgi:hypothetical protein